MDLIRVYWRFYMHYGLKLTFRINCAESDSFDN